MKGLSGNAPCLACVTNGMGLAVKTSFNLMNKYILK